MENIVGGNMIEELELSYEDVEKYQDAYKKNVENMEYYGVEKQLGIWIEELSELTKALCKYQRHKLEGENIWEDISNIKDEVTDVVVCLDQIRTNFIFTDDKLIDNYAYKVYRQVKRIEEEQNAKRED